MAASKQFMPGSDYDADEIFQYPFFNDEKSKEFIQSHGKIMFIVRGPPGTGKNSLTDMLLQNYPSGIKCSASAYFTKLFASTPTGGSFKKSHDHCRLRVKQECLKGTHPVIICNSHVKKKEMQEYLNYAAEYGYTVIIASTLDKFKVSPEILEKTNSKGLNKTYFEKRLKAWQDIVLLLMGWFLNAEDSLCLLHQLQFALDALLGDGRFCTVFNAFDKESILKYYQAKEVLFCVAGFRKSTPKELKDYYTSSEVRDAYGKCFNISVQEYVITKSDIFALVHLDEELKPLTFTQNFKNNSNEEDTTVIVQALDSISLQKSYKLKLVSLENDFSSKCKSMVLKDKSFDSLNIDGSSFIHIAERDEKIFSPWRLNKLLRSSFDGISNHNGKVSADKFIELEDGFKFCRLLNDAWLVSPPKDLSVETVFTGLYI